ncbi:MAG: hypothetical protein PHG97_01200 [Candidatus Margulisbacteria bacterium]|nr:hypothetical protein [Candidatus Margulisiibacteriota bacterium]
MVTPVAFKPIIRLSQRALPALRGVVAISSFAIGKDRLGPCLTKIFKTQGIELKDIHLDSIAKIRLLGMQPSLEERAAGNETAESIFSSLELSAFLTRDQELYILGDKGNIKLMAAGSAESTPATTVPTAPQPPPSDNPSTYDIEIINRSPREVSFVIKNITAKRTSISAPGCDPIKEEKIISLEAKLSEDKMELSSPEHLCTAVPIVINIENLSDEIEQLSWATPNLRSPSDGGDGYEDYRVGLNLFQIVKAIRAEAAPKDRAATEAPQPPLSAEEFRAKNIGPSLWGRSYSEEYEARLAGQAPSKITAAPLPPARLYDENGNIIQAESERRAARLEEMGVKLYSSYNVTEDVGPMNYHQIEVEKFKPYPDWLKDGLIAHYDLIRRVFELHGKERLAKMFECLGKPDIQILLRKESNQSGTHRLIGSFIELMEFIGKSRYYDKFGAWLERNREEIGKDGLGRLLFVATNASPEEIDRMLNII